MAMQLASDFAGSSAGSSWGLRLLLAAIEPLPGTGEPDLARSGPKFGPSNIAITFWSSRVAVAAARELGDER